jgi:hypothetical protein
MNLLLEKISRIFRSVPGGISAAAAGLFAAALAAYSLTVVFPPAVDLRYSFYLDSASFYWLQALWDRGLFGGDPLAALYYSNMFRFCPESFWVWPTALFVKAAGYAAGLKLLAVAACAASALLLRRLALASPARPAAGAATLLFAVLFLSTDTFFGVPRVYGCLVFLAYAWAAEERRFTLLPLLAALCFAVYPVLAAGLAATSLLVPFFFREEFSDRRLVRSYLAALAAGAAVILIFLGLSRVVLHATPDPENLRAFEMDKFYQRVSGALDPRNPVDALSNFIFNFNEHSRLYRILSVLFALIYGLGVLVQPRRPGMLPRVLLPLLAGCAAAFVVLYPMHPVTASRQLVFILPLALVFLAAEGIMTIFGEKFRTAPAALALGGLFLCLHPFFNEVYSMRAYAQVYDFFSAQPRGSVVAGYPESDLLFTIPVFAAQPAVLSAGTADQELLFLTSLKNYAARRRELFSALYCTDPGAPGRLASGSGVKWLLFEKNYYSPAFLAGAAASPRPADRETAALLAAGGDPAACYAAYSSKAAFSWKNGGSEGFAVRLAEAAK